MSSKHTSAQLHLQRLVLAALLAAISILCGKYLAFPREATLRFSFENLPLLMAGFSMGPWVGAMTAVVADLVGCVLVGYPVNPTVTLGAAVIGLLGGLCFSLLKRLPLFWRISIASLAAHAVGSVGIKTMGLSQYYDMPFFTLLLWRTLNYAIILVLEVGLLLLFFKHKAIYRQLSRFGRL